MNLAVSTDRGPLSLRSQVRWRLAWENELRLADHIELSEFFQNTYGPTGAFNAKPFEGNHSWAGARPEVRAIGYDARGVAAHVGALRRFIKVGAVDLLVAELGLYAVRPDLEGLGIPHLMRVMYPVLQELDVPFGFGTVRHALRQHIARLLGRHGLATIVSGVRVRSTLREVHLDTPPTRIEDVLIVVLPIGRSMSDWPTGTIIDRNGPEL
ncbi:beta-1,4-N-acetylglucosamine oligosaccharide N-acyltransferase NodA [Paraburkholderia sp. BL18I3N2]|nr:MULTISPECIES: NodA family N-acyltransferase [unclassified Paraburkholderia]PRX17206.1 beta-1,4-N-acetylglucosamine oligosaccharide N-acyltransferase NodA [Paraburkholderia sp. BL18I3N2]PRX83393.1 beta-1,4-N-acetylglucosamine oligosaccharide N-acyltransferase NodA [Paraburkholderia sp. BL25I1N1]TDY17187.1 beta-1,4-N-acetylglucosamine oligosaccharide N-acyltransferase NodA [Paraburkholderia sp. BL6665CI2N2]